MPIATGSGWSRRRFLVASGASALGVLAAGCGSDGQRKAIGATDPAVAKREAQRRVAGAGRKVVDLVAGAVSLDLAGRVVQTVGYGGTVPGPEIRVRAGDELEVRFRNELSTPTTIHWHGLAIRNDMDGVPAMTQPRIEPGKSFTYRFIVPDAGTHWFHPHMGLDLDRGLYAPIVVESPDEPVDYDAEAILVLDDWLDGIDGTTPEETYRDLVDQGGMASKGRMNGGAGAPGGMGGMGGMSHEMGGSVVESMTDFGDVVYPLHLVNGRPPADPLTVATPAGGRVRLRLVNAGSDTVYRVAVGGQTMTVTHLDGFPIEPVETDAVRLSMGERVDVIVQPSSGAWPIHAVAEGKDGSALAVLRTSDSEATAAPNVGNRLAEHDRRLFDDTTAKATESAALKGGRPSRSIKLALTGGMMSYAWGINGRAFGKHKPVEIEEGERVQLVLRNETMMVHPMHLHGHTFALPGERGARKDTVLVYPGTIVSVDLLADNPGQWMLHCHNTYHLEAGMATELSYVQ